MISKKEKIIFLILLLIALPIYLMLLMNIWGSFLEPLNIWETFLKALAFWLAITGLLHVSLACAFFIFPAYTLFLVIKTCLWWNKDKGERHNLYLGIQSKGIHLSYIVLILMSFARNFFDIHRYDLSRLDSNASWAATAFLVGIVICGDRDLKEGLNINHAKFILLSLIAVFIFMFFMLDSIAYGLFDKAPRYELSRVIDSILTIFALGIGYYSYCQGQFMRLRNKKV